MKWTLLVGIAVTLVLVTPLVAGWLGKRRSERDFPQAAAKLGLELEGLRVPGRLGRYRGTHRGRRVVVRPEAFGLVRVALTEEPALSLSTEKQTAVQQATLQPFTTGDGAFDRAFPHRYASPELAERIRRNDPLRRRLLEFYAERRGELRSFSVDAEFLSVTMGGLPFFHYIPAERLEPLLDAMVELANAVEPELR